ncbi:hypothetical protein JTE90_019943 [Oedothorax gibbosus]|uniref:Invertebrate defensins family profile domain-containing protein n=1 Tax=Oedothorax gibbosus TaxID=931172 RepID=A0AAV6UQ78_9ARAC|nr:hypothetical protein JTE90_019943 [Oedothorax gibbosus]
MQKIDRLSIDHNFKNYLLVRILIDIFIRSMELLLVCFLIALALSAFAMVAEAGFGCPLDQTACHVHCKSVSYRGGYCGNFLKLTCKSYRRKVTPGVENDGYDGLEPEPHPVQHAESTIVLQAEMDMLRKRFSELELKSKKMNFPFSHIKEDPKLVLIKLYTGLPNVETFYIVLGFLIDCTEIFIETPRENLRAQKDTYFAYKNGQTFIGLIAVSPNGVICFVSKLYPWSSSDKHIVQDSEFCNLRT